LSKVVRKQVLDDNRWFNVYKGSVVVSYCERCGCQRTHMCMDTLWKDDGLWFVLVCDFCRFNNKEDLVS
jgi:hypothetical protein